MTHKQFSDLVESSSDAIFRVVFFMLRDKDESQDVLQETFIKFWENNNLHKIENPSGYLMTMAKNLTIDKIRKKKNDKKILSELNKEDFQPEFETQLTKNNSKYKMILDFVNQLKDKQKTVFILREIEGLTYQEISEYLNITEAQVKVNLHRARTAIKNHFS